tara:strand:- start:6019 stop:6252 length:234 start_codon:yes stop_codon:yes gene_type:complete
MSEIKTTEDGWDCVPELQEVVSKIEELDHYKYEIKNCVREAELDHMVVEMKEMMEEAIEMLDNINVDREFITVDDDE